MTIQYFTHKYSFKNADKAIAAKVYGTTHMTEKQWVAKLEKEFDFDHSNFKEEIESTIVPILIDTTEEIPDEQDALSDNSEVANISVNKEKILDKIKSKRRDSSQKGKTSNKN